MTPAPGFAEEPRRQAVIVLGMHRSGTSAAAGAVLRFGLAGPRTPLPPSQDNPLGFHESWPVVEVNHRILLEAGCAWNLCLKFRADRARGLRPAEDQVLAELLRAEFGCHGPFVLKDPRLCLTLPAWRPALHAVRADPKILLVVRHPAEVVRSLSDRNALPEAQTAANWLHHMLEAERQTRRDCRAVLTYDALLADWRSCLTTAARTAGIAWPRPMAEAAAEIDTFLGHGLRHHATPDAPAAVGPAPVCDMVAAAWRSFQHLANVPEAPGALAWLDHLRTEFHLWQDRTGVASQRVVLPYP